MAVRPVLRFPHEVLKQHAKPVADLDEEALAVAQELLDTMRASSHSVGLAAPQIGVGLRVFCIDVTGHRKANSCHGELVLFNPVIVRAEAPEVAREGCMSVPDLTGDVPRATRLTVRGLDLQGEEVELECDAFEARAVQHEVDHLDGKLFLDRVLSPRELFHRKVYR